MNFEGQKLFESLIFLNFSLMNKDKKLGVTSICIGGGEALSMLVERM